MSRKTSQILASGLLAASMIVMGLELWSPSRIQSTQAHSSDSLIENVSLLEDKVNELEQENRRLNDEIERLSEGYSNGVSLSDFEDEEAEKDVDEEKKDDETQTENTESDVQEDPVREFTVTVKEGEPSSVVAEQLEELGVIEDRHAFNTFLEKNDYAKKVRPGNYVVTSEMNENELAQAIVR